MEINTGYKLNDTAGMCQCCPLAFAVSLGAFCKVMLSTQTQKSINCSTLLHTTSAQCTKPITSDIPQNFEMRDAEHIGRKCTPRGESATMFIPV